MSDRHTTAELLELARRYGARVSEVPYDGITFTRGQFGRLVAALLQPRAHLIGALGGGVVEVPREPCRTSVAYCRWGFPMVAPDDGAHEQAASANEDRPEDVQHVRSLL